MRRFFRILLKSVAGLLILLIGVVLVLGFLGVKLDLSHLRPGVEVAAGQALDRKVTIAGPVLVEFSNWPAIEVSGVKIANAPGATEPAFLNAGLARMRIGVFPLLRGEINIAEITAEKVTLNLESDAKGKPNWVFGEGAAPQPDEPVETASDDDGKLITFAALDQLSFKQIKVNYRDKALKKSLSFELDSMVGTAAENKPVLLDLAGKIQDKKYELEIEGSPLSDLQHREKPWDFEMKGEVFGKEIASKGDMLIKDRKPHINLALGVRQVDVGQILAAMGLVEGMQASLGDVGIKISINGNSLREILVQSVLRFTVKNGNWNIQIPNTEGSIDIQQLFGDILVEKGNNITMTLEGIVDKTPVKLLITGAPLVEYVTKQDQIPLAIDAEFAKSKLHFATNVKLPLSVRDITLVLKANSERIDHLNELLRLDLPAIGPVSLESRLKLTNAGYELSKLAVQVGESHLDGELKLGTSQTRPKLDVSLVSKLIQLNDFETGAPKPTAEKKPEAETDAKKEVTEKTSDETEMPPKNGGRKLLSYEVLSAFDADVKIEAQDVRSGKDELGSALLQVGLKDARLAVEPLHMNIPGGDIKVAMDYTPSPADVDFNVKANIEDFDIGVLARQAKPDADMGGTIKLDAELHAQAPDAASLMQNANGHFDFALVPENFSSGIIDLWAVNLLSAIMDKSTEKDQSEINCVVVRFGIEDGLMEEKAIYLDTSNMRIAGKSDINFHTRKLEIKLAPKAKKPEFFSMAIPIQVKGSFDDFGFKMGAVRLAGQVVSFITSPVHVPIRRIFTEEAPADGIEACKAAWRKSGKEESDAKPHREKALH